MKVSQLSKDEYNTYFNAYIQYVDDTWSLTEWLEVSLHEFIKFVQEIPMGKHDYRYAEGKWTIKDIIQHLIDAERVFNYRAMRISRGDTTDLPGYEQDDYVVTAKANDRTIQSLLTEMSALRHATILFFKSLNEDDLLKKGMASGYAVSARALGFLIVGHEKHHINVFQERYL
ncbi:MAG: damage-inducible protein DinB [Flavobacterium sp. MedPE-SWcel]|uniref:DinB family protein n=1 Tax=uncultured Flavobacterium sp. TaxID=165435 RepID=UPI0009231304|nr:DinB family protein [uncultured Flavobacterium sp.]OIQ16957.1 MAG: damage-inducible protein DinB [Flavobacterium sp. MedPE-SWcel]